ncbi:MAG: hypothetical protein LIO79_08205 [Rikenellaceae bacterium]|nr:hypothetical protein [Rikenellaceae bacterium]
MEKFKNRLLELINIKSDGVKSSFAKKIGVQPSVIENYVGKRMSKPSFEIIYKIITAFPDVDANWLITGNCRYFESKTDVGRELMNFFTEMDYSVERVADELKCDIAEVEEYFNGRAFDDAAAEVWGNKFCIQPSWLLTGTGNMFKRPAASNGSKWYGLNNVNYAADSRSDYDSKNISELKADNKSLLETVRDLTTSNNMLVSTNSGLANEVIATKKKIDDLESEIRRLRILLEKQQ